MLQKRPPLAAEGSPKGHRLARGLAGPGQTGSCEQRRNESARFRLAGGSGSRVRIVGHRLPRPGPPRQADSVRPHDLFLHFQIMARTLVAFAGEFRRRLDVAQAFVEAARGEGQAVFPLDAPGTRGHDEQALAEEQRLFHAVGDEDDRLAGVPPQLQDQRLHLLQRQRVQRPQRLVHQNELRVVGQAARQGDTLLHAPRELVDRLVPETLQADGIEQVLHPGGGLAGGHTAHLRAEADVLGDVQPLEQRPLLKHHPALRSGSGDLMRAERRLPTGRGEEAGEDVEQGGLAAP